METNFNHHAPTIMVPWTHLKEGHVIFYYGYPAKVMSITGLTITVSLGSVLGIRTIEIEEDLNGEYSTNFKLIKLP